jgi:hypothetical protein
LRSPTAFVNAAGAPVRARTLRLTVSMIDDPDS